MTNPVIDALAAAKVAGVDPLDELKMVSFADDD